MENGSDIQPATQESVWAAFRETDRMFKESDERFDRRNAEFEKKIKKSRRDFDKQLKASREDFDKQLKASREDFEKKFKESREDYDRRSADLNKQLKELSEQVGGWGNSHGLFAEEYFINSFKNGAQTFFGEQFDDYENNLKGIEPGFKDEYDFVFFNCQSIGIVEVKFKARDKDVDKVIKKAKTFRINYPKYHNHRFYLGLAALTFEDHVEQNCIDQGIALIKQVGDTVVINDEHLKVY